jgi:predicted glycosyl hydrolase (DUF1957 family)
MDFVLALHSHLPYVLNHGRWPHGSDWICEAAIDTYLPLLAALHRLQAEAVSAPITLGITPVLANQFESPVFAAELEAYFAQHLKRVCRYLLGIGHDAMDHLQPVDIRLMFLPTAIAVRDRFGNEA